MTMGAVDTGAGPAGDGLLVAGPTHAEVLAGLQQACFPEDPWSAAAIRGMQEQPGTAGLIGMESGEPVGFVLFRTVAEDAEILAIGVLPEARRSGLGRRLLDHAVAAAGAAGATAVFLEVAEDNAAARWLYSSAGFVQVGRRPDYYRRADGRVAALVLRFPYPAARIPPVADVGDPA